MNNAKNMTRARDLLVPIVHSIRVDEPLSRAMEQLVELQASPDTPNAVIVVDASGEYRGILTARLLFRTLLTLWMPSNAVLDNEERLEEELLAVARERSDVKVSDALIRGLPTAKLDDRILSLIVWGCEKKMEFIPVVENGQPRGVVPITAILQWAASLALTPEDEGIRMDR